ncbi:MAG: hypothetical protein KY476_26195 [Planctomycetes bacterium]|nr:hypothetical protein [Planctomycetota bacterium]
MNTFVTCSLASFVAAVCLPFSGVAAENESKTAPESTEEASQETTSDPDSSKPLGKKLDSELLKRLLGDTPAGDGPAGENLLERAIHGMRSAGERIDAADTGDETRGIQQQVVDDLAKLIELAESQPPPQPNPQPGSPEEQNQQRQRSPENQPMPQNDQDQSSQGGEGEGTGEATQQTQSDRARESAEREGRSEDEREAALDRRRSMVQDVWGHLPPSVRKKFLSLSGEEYLPHYEDLVRRYFEALAEQDRGRE